ncbi:MAG: hypothetical protein MJY67_03570 [Bacteroidales bacterium]|nr:hypothetical protein [Bacteroidales bacterium]
MKRGIITILLWLIAAAVLVAAAVFGALYTKIVSDEGTEKASVSYSALCGVPTDAVAVVSCQKLSGMTRLYSDKTLTSWEPLASAAAPDFLSFMSCVERRFRNDQLRDVSSSQAAVSFHYTGDLMPVFVLDAGEASPNAAGGVATIRSMADSLGLYTGWFDGQAQGSVVADGHSMLVVSTASNLVKSSIAHLRDGSSVHNAEGFMAAYKQVKGGDNVLYLSHGKFGKIFSSLTNKRYLDFASFFKKIGKWTVLSLDKNSSERMLLKGIVSTGKDADDFMNVFSKVQGGVPQAPSMLPKKTYWALSLPIKDFSTYVGSYQEFADSRIGLSKFLARQKSLQKSAGVSPSDWISGLAPKEVVVASFLFDGAVESVLLMRAPDADRKILFHGQKISSSDQYTPACHKYKFKSFAASLLGEAFAIEKETHFTYLDGWVIVGSEDVVKGYLDGSLLKHPLSQAGFVSEHSDINNLKNVAMWIWLPMSQNEDLIATVFKKDFASAICDGARECFESQIVAYSKEKSGDKLYISAVKGEKPEPSFDELEEVSVPKGPFTVENSGTGKKNKFVCADGKIMLVEDGEQLWSIPFEGALCGRVKNVDLFANKRLQFVFVSGDKLYVVDRLGNIVKDYPRTLSKEVLLGPDVYDFNGTRKYNVMVLNTDNTLDLYNMKGEKPSSWKGISCDEKILALPEYFTVDGKSHWVVRTATRTLVYTLLGGEPIKTLPGYVKIEEITQTL